MRIANQNIFDAVRQRLSKTNDELYKATQVVSSGKRINTLSDDPVALVQTLSIRSSLSNMEQLGRNIATGRTWLNAGETTLESVKELIVDAKVLGIQMVNGTMGDSERLGAAKQVEGILEHMVSLANTTVNGQYLFSGTATDRKPFQIEFDGEGNPIGVPYSGNADPFTVKIGQEIHVPVGHNGEEVFGNSLSGIFKTLIDLKGHLETNDMDGLQQSIANLDRDHLHMVDTVSLIGAREMRLDIKGKIMGDLAFSYKEKRSNLEDADIIEAISTLRAKETAYEAALASSAKIMKMNLLDYI
jgi:flagellar hook-associated protein 3 FlgL